MSSPLEIDRSTISELTQLRQQILELQQVSVQSIQHCPSTQPTALEAAHVGTWEWDSRTSRVIWSPETEQIFGLPPGTFDGSYDGFFARVHLDDRHRLSAAITKAIHDYSPYRVEHRIITPSGATRWVACRGRVARSENDLPSGMIGTIEDITTRKEFELTQQTLRETLETLVQERTAGLERAVHELKTEIAQRQQAEVALKVSEQRYQSLYEQNPFMYFTLSPDGTLLSVNNFGVDQLGYHKEDLIGRSILELFDPKDHQTVLGQLTVCAASPYTVFHWETQKIRKDGVRIWVKERARAIHDDTNQILILVVCENITERKRTEDQLHQSIQAKITSETRLRSFLDALDDLAFEFDRNGTFLNVWTGNHEKLALPKQDLIGKRVSDLFGQETGSRYLETIRQVISTGHTKTIDYAESSGGISRYFSGILTLIPAIDEGSSTVGCIVRDTTERRHIEEQSQESEARWRALYEHAGVGIAQLSLNGNFLRVSPYLCAMLHCPSETMLQLRFHDFTHPDDLPSNLEYVNKLLTGKQPSLSIEKRYRRSDGTWVWGNLTLSVVRTASGNPAYFIAVIQPIDDRKRSASLLQAAINSVADGLLVIDRQGKVTSVNQRFMTLWNIPQGLADSGDDGTLLTFVIDQLQEPEVFLSKVRELYAHPEQESFDVVTFKDGRVFERYSRPQILDNEIVGRVWSFRDITEHKRAEQALQESELRLQRFVAEAPVGLCILDENWRAVTANLAFCQLTGYEGHEIIGSTYALYTHPEDLSANIRLTEEFYRGVRSGYTFEKRYIRKSGEIIWVLVKTARVDLPGRQGPLLLAAVQDITERKLALEEREQLSRDLHDNLLQALYAVGMQLEASKLAMGQSLRRSKTHISQAIRQLNRLMVDVRGFITLLTERTSVQMDFRQSLQEVIVSTANTEGVATELDIKSPVLSFITPQIGDQLLSITREALSNSLRHARASRRWLHLSLVHDSIRLLIGDNGIGFSPSRKRRTGRGLANMAARAQQIAASFALESAPSGGTTITVNVPLRKDALYE